MDHLVHTSCGSTIEVENEEYQKELKHVCALWNDIPKAIILHENELSANFKYILTIDEKYEVAKNEISDREYLIIQIIGQNKN